MDATEEVCGEGWIGSLGRANANYKDLLYSTGDYIQYPVIKHNGKEYEKACVCVYTYIYIYINIYVYKAESLCCTAEINVTL